MDKIPAKIAVPVLNWTLPDYIDAFSAGGAELIQVFEDCDPSQFAGLLLPGGEDISPEYYHQENVRCLSVNSKLDQLQFQVTKYFVDAGKPVLGICRGHQLLNIYFGGTLSQHIPFAENHMERDDKDNKHMISCARSSRLYELFGERCMVNSSHHQGIDIPGKEINIIAWSDDGTPEAIEHTNLPIYGVQFHPERMCGVYAESLVSDGMKIIQAFIASL